MRGTGFAPGGVYWREVLRRHSEDVAQRRGIALPEATTWLRMYPHVLARPYVIKSDLATRPGGLGPQPAVVLAVRIWDRDAPEGWAVALIEARRGRDTYAFDPDFSPLISSTQMT